MANQLSIKTANITRFANALHASFQLAVYEVVSSQNTSDLQNWRVEPFLSDWKASIDMELEITRETVASINTQLLDSLDKQRDRIITYIFEFIKNERANGLIEARTMAAARLYLIIRTYSGLKREAYQEQTAQIISLITDLKKSQSLADLQVLGLDYHIDSLQSVNEEFKELYSSRSTNKAKSRLPSAREQRIVTDALYKNVCKRLTGAFDFVDTSAEQERINAVVALMNQRIDDHRARYNQATGQTTKSTTGGGTVTPSGSGTSSTTTEPEKADGE